MRQGSGSRNVLSILHQITESAYEVPATGSIDDVVRRIHTAVEKTRSRHRDRQIVFCLPGMPGKEFVRVIASILDAGRHGKLGIREHGARCRCTHYPEQSLRQRATRPTLALDSVPGMDALGDDLRDDATGRLNAEKVRDLFGIRMTAIADAAGISKQGLDRTRTAKRLSRCSSFLRASRACGRTRSSKHRRFAKMVPSASSAFSNHSAEDLFKAGKLEVVAEKVDQMLTGDFGGSVFRQNDPKLQAALRAAPAVPYADSAFGDAGR